MTDKSAFTDEEWHVLTDAPLLVTEAVFLAGEHGPISMMKEAGASARAISRPGERGVANELIGQIVAEANTKETRAHAREHHGTTRGPRSKASCMNWNRWRRRCRNCRPTRPHRSSHGWSRIGEAVAESAKTVNPDEQATLGKLRTLFGIAAT